MFHDESNQNRTKRCSIYLCFDKILELMYSKKSSGLGQKLLKMGLKFCLKLPGQAFIFYVIYSCRTLLNIKTFRIIKIP